MWDLLLFCIYRTAAHKEKSGKNLIHNINK